MNGVDEHQEMTTSRRDLKIALLFPGMGLLGACLLLVLESGSEGLWYYRTEHWIMPTFRNFVVADSIGISVFLLGCSILHCLGWARVLFACLTASRVITAVALSVSHVLAFSLVDRIRDFPMSLGAADVLMAGSISLTLWLLSNFWSTRTAIALLAGLFLSPNVAPVLRLTDSFRFSYPFTIAVVVGLCGLWIALAERNHYNGGRAQ
jgi:hypothetical protein